MLKVLNLIFSALIFCIVPSHALVNAKLLNDHPDVVRLIFSNGWVCSGAYIDKFTILTAAHCISFEDEEPIPELVKIQSHEDISLDVRPIKFLPHPMFKSQKWHSFDVGLIKTTENVRFARNFVLEREVINFSGKVKLFGAGRIDQSKMEYSRTWGENHYFRISHLLFLKGDSIFDLKSQGLAVSIAPNDSGGLLVDVHTNKIIGVMTTTTLKHSLKYNLPTISTGTSTVSRPNLDFILSHMGLER